jgi:hypothetical protein
VSRAHRGFASPWWDFGPGSCRGFFPCGHVGVAGVAVSATLASSEADMTMFLIVVLLLLIGIGIFVRRAVFK